ncbi:helix-turn-helix domain-containing protein [Actinoalloteichus fjordicus]|uniref:DNA binding protein with helix-turn-helix domain n=1 Tax=Actinoalloteichus fjordicus TaxID=1612552 RepID=A0AAC9LGW3_9PSEU|nr:helix-turn-helix transcriptional regulator [Actinoalloteichus fjordicus]APU17461.1 DNA binding protein with helix-turn-helix domain [Actinoalloteichus fjordicus]
MNLPPQNNSGAPNVHEARVALGKRLRELRRRAGLTGMQLAESLSWPQSKVSKLETARQTPSPEDIRAWIRITDSGSQTEELLTALQTLEAQHAEWQRVLNPGLQPHQQKLSELDAKTRVFRAFEATVIPGLLQTAAYARARMAQGVILYNANNDIGEAVRARMRRQELLYREDKRFHFVITEAALRLRLSAPNVMLAQLDRLVSLSTLPNVRLGVISSSAQYVVGPWHGFWLRDNERVLIETFSAELNLVQAPEIALYSKIFEQFAAIATYGRSAREIITCVADELASEASPEGE